MKINFDQQNQTTFNAKVSERFVDSMSRYINSGSNRLKNNYLLNSKVQEFDNFGYKDYTIQMLQKQNSFGAEYRLVAVKDGESAEKGILLGLKRSYRGIYETFMNYDKSTFCRKMHPQNK